MEPMVAGTELRRAVLLEDDPSVSFAVTTMLERRGFEVAAIVELGADAIQAADQFQPRVVVADLALSGGLGLRIVSAFLAAAPRAAVVLVSPFERLRPEALQAGARELVGMNDLRYLARCIQHLDEPSRSFCECCRPTSGGATSTTFDAQTSRISAESDEPAWWRYYDPTSGSGTSTSGNRSKKPPSS